MYLSTKLTILQNSLVDSSISHNRLRSQTYIQMNLLERVVVGSRRYCGYLFRLGFPHGWVHGVWMWMWMGVGVGVRVGVGVGVGVRVGMGMWVCMGTRRWGKIDVVRGPNRRSSNRNGRALGHSWSAGSGQWQHVDVVLRWG